MIYYAYLRTTPHITQASTLPESRWACITEIDWLSSFLNNTKKNKKNIAWKSHLAPLPPSASGLRLGWWQHSCQAQSENSLSPNHAKRGLWMLDNACTSPDISWHLMTYTDHFWFIVILKYSLMFYIDSIAMIFYLFLMFPDPFLIFLLVELLCSSSSVSTCCHALLHWFFDVLCFRCDPIISNIFQHIPTIITIHHCSRLHKCDQNDIKCAHLHDAALSLNSMDCFSKSLLNDRPWTRQNLIPSLPSWIGSSWPAPPRTASAEAACFLLASESQRSDWSGLLRAALRPHAAASRPCTLSALGATPGLVPMSEHSAHAWLPHPHNPSLNLLTRTCLTWSLEYLWAGQPSTVINCIPTKNI